MGTPTLLVVNRPIYLQVRDNLLERIGFGEWKVGTQMPNEPSLAREYHVSGGTMRRALEVLEAEMVVRRQQGRGTYVTSQKPVAVCPTCKRAMATDVEM